MLFTSNLLKFVMDIRSKLIDSISDKDQRVFVKFCLLHGYSGAETHEGLRKAVGTRVVALSTVESWLTKFRRGETDVGEARGGDRSDAALKAQRITQVQECLADSRHWSTRPLASHTDIPQATVHRILSQELKMRKILSK